MDIKKIIEDFLLPYGAFSSFVGVVIYFLLRNYISGYLPEKGKQLATNENFQEILSQAKQSVAATEEIRNALAGNHWIKQQFWNRKAEYYLELLSELGALIIHIQDKHGVLPRFKNSGFIVNEDSPAKEGNYIHASLNNLQKLVIPASIFLSEKSKDAISNLMSNYYETADNITTDSDFLLEMLEHVCTAQDVIIQESKNDLNGLRL